MRETPLSNCERLFLLRAIAERKRLDGRQTYDYRNIKITFGTEYGCCIVELGKTRVLGQVSCELVSPKMNRPTEGILFFNLELSSMASPGFEAGRQSELLVKLNRLLERCLRNSKCIDTESLCVAAGEKHTAFIKKKEERPDVSIQGDDVTVYTPEERDPVPLSIHHMPICVSFSFFQQGTYLLVDPSEREERVMDGLLVIAMNKHREICTIQSSGGIMLSKDQILRCSKIACVKVAEITELIMKALENDKIVRKEGGKFGFAELIPDQRITALKMERAPVDTSDVEEKAEEILSQAEPPSEAGFLPVLRTPGTAQIGEGLESSWRDLEESEEDEDEEEGGNDESAIKENQDMDVIAVEPTIRQPELIVLSDSEEEEVIILQPEGARPKSRTDPQPTQQDNSMTKKKNNKKKKKPAR